MYEYIVLDTETTGIDKYNDEILQLSIIDQDGKVLFNHYLKPTHTESWDRAMQVNHISPKMVATEKPISDYSDEINRILSEAKVIIGYNVSFDLGMLEGSGIRIPWEKRTVDVMKEFAPIYGDFKGYGSRHGSRHGSRQNRRSCAILCGDKVSSQRRAGGRSR